MAKYRVESYHINIGTGDAAIHMQLREPVGGFETTVDTVVLVDGGLGSHGPAIIREVFNSTEFRDRFYYHRENPTEPKESATRFNAIVVTHWDSDHAAGLYNLVAEDLKVEGEKFVQANKIKTNSVFKTKVNEGKVWSSICHYKDYLPTTILYSPYWDPSQSKCRPKPHKTHIAGLDLTQSGGQDYVTFNISFVCEPEPGHGNVSYSAKVPALKLGYHGRDLIGMDLFAGSRVLTADQAVSPEAVQAGMFQLQDTGQRDHGQPGMICIGNDGLVGAENPPTARQSDQTVSLKTWKPNLSTNSIDKTEKDGNNAASVVCMIFWPDQNIIRVSHYFAGDAPDLVERKVLDWAMFQGQSIHASAIKLSHHGKLLL